MTDKRFTMVYGKYKDNKTGIKYDEKLESWKVCELLNALHEENQELKRLIKATVEDYTDLKQSFDLIDKDNERLKQQVQKIHNLINSKIQSARELGSVKTVVALKNLQRELNGDV